MHKLNRWLPLVLSICLLAPFSNDVFVPSLPEIARIFQTDKTQLLISTFMLGLASAQIFYGPLSDRFGRKPILIIGLSIFILASVAVMFAKSFDHLLVARFAQALGACCTMPSAMSILRDSYPHDKLLKPISYLMGSVIIGPMIAPVFGSYLAAYFGWRGSFAFLLALGIFYWLIVVFLFKETLSEKNHHALHFKHIFKVYSSLLKHRTYTGFLLTAAFMYAGIFSYVAAAPFIFIHIFQIPVKDFGWYFLLFAVVFLILSLSAMASSLLTIKVADPLNL